MVNFGGALSLFVLSSVLVHFGHASPTPASNLKRKDKDVPPLKWFYPDYDAVYPENFVLHCPIGPPLASNPDSPSKQLVRGEDIEEVLKTNRGILFPQEVDPYHHGIVNIGHDDSRGDADIFISFQFKVYHPTQAQTVEYTGGVTKYVTKYVSTLLIATPYARVQADNVGRVFSV